MKGLRRQDYDFEVWDYIVKDTDTWSTLRKNHQLERDGALDAVKSARWPASQWCDRHVRLHCPCECCEMIERGRLIVSQGYWASLAFVRRPVNKTKQKQHWLKYCLADWQSPSVRTVFVHKIGTTAGNHTGTYGNDRSRGERGGMLIGFVICTRSTARIHALTSCHKLGSAIYNYSPLVCEYVSFIFVHMLRTLFDSNVFIVLLNDQYISILSSCSEHSFCKQVRVAE